MFFELKKWIIATRPWSITASATPVIVVSTWLFCQGSIAQWTLIPAVIGGAVLFQLAGNLISDYFDYTRGVDTLETAGSRTLPDKIFLPGTVLFFGWTLLGIAILLGMYLVVKSDSKLLYFGFTGTVSVIFYYWMKYHGLGLILIFWIFGPGIALGTEYALTRSLSWPVFLLSLPIGLITTAILHANDLRDMSHDRSAHIVTFSLLIGEKKAKCFYRILVTAPYFLIGFYCCFCNFSPRILVTLVTITLAGSAIRSLNDSVKINDLDRKTALLQTYFAVMLVLSFF